MSNDIKQLSQEDSDRYHEAGACILAHLSQHSENLDDAFAILTSVVFSFVMHMATEGHEREALDTLVKGFKETLEDHLKGRTQ